MRIRFSGLGGQGVVVSGVIYGHAALLDGHNVLQRQSYGSTTRGGVTTSDVTIAADEICELESPQCDLLISLCQEAHDRFRHMLITNGTLISEASLVDVKETQEIRHVPLPAIEMARERLGRQILANIVILGAVGKLISHVSQESLKKAILAHVPKGTEKLNMQAFSLGLELI